MPEEPSGTGGSPRAPAGPKKDRSELPRGPRMPRGLIIILISGVLALVVYKIATESGRQYKELSFSGFQEKWDARTGTYVGFDKAELKDDLLLVRPTPALAKAVTGKAADPAKTDPAKTDPAKTDSAKADAATTEKAPTATGTPIGEAPEKADDGDEKRLWYRIRIPGTAIDSDFLKQLATIPDFSYQPSSQLLSVALMYALWLGVFVLLFYFLVVRPLRSQNGPGNVLAFGRSRPKLIAKDHSGVKFDDVAGIEEAKEEVAEVIEFLKNPQKFSRLGGRIPRGLLFVGSPGTGKTLLAKAIAGEADVPFYSICGSDFVEMFVGVGASRVRDLFRQAKENTPCIIFLDEVDAVGRRRGGGMGGGHDEREQTLNAILVEMDGFDTNEQVIVIASTNRPDVLDPALLRPGRFDREIVIDLPDLKGRYEILKVHARNIKLGADADLMRLARGTPMFSGADLEAIINEAAIRASMEGKEAVEHTDLEEARDKVRFGREKRSRVLDEHDRKVTAYHEAGHALLTRLVSDVEPLHKVTIIPRGMSLGSTMFLPLKDRYTHTRNQMLGQLKVLYGGRLAEEMFCHDISSGASQDIEHATQIARKMVCDFGMSDELGPIRYTSSEQHIYLGGEVSHPREFSEATAEKIDAAVHGIVDQCYREAREVLKGHTREMELLAKALLKHETLTDEQINRIFEADDVDVIPAVEEVAEPLTDSIPGADSAASRADDDVDELLADV